MLSEERQSLILERLRTKRAVTVQELVQDLDSSAATIRRDLTELHQKGLLQKGARRRCKLRCRLFHHRTRYVDESQFVY